MKIIDYIQRDQILKEFEFENMGQCVVNEPKLLTFVDDKKFVGYIDKNTSISGVIIKPEFIGMIKREDVGIVISNSPRIDFFLLHNELNFPNEKKIMSISNSAKIAETALLKGDNIYIGKNVIIEDYVIINNNTYIGDNSIIRSGVKIGGDGFEFKKADEEILRVNHYGGVIINSNVEIKENCTIHKAVFNWDNTEIDNHTKIDAMTHIAHGVKIEKRVLIGSKCNIAGNCVIQKDAYIGPGVTITNRVNVGRNTKVSIGSVVTKDVADNIQVSGNFAIDHEKYIKHIKEIR